jgi:hypothetical protein
MRIALVIFVSFLLSSSSSSAQTHANSSKSAQYIDALVSYPDFGRIYVEDGAADGSVTNREPLPQAVSDILDLGAKASPTKRIDTISPPLEGEIKILTPHGRRRGRLST